ncbi:MAG TPA: hypothetical protein VGR06_28375 [Actinophytocola sp.]|jgi:hypothetical protein|uniref:hypothetical protein n=1 Tax=Actinophytocola sp. TaxID=1872138 RepID=UPI002DFB1590|nr:hypothetical protein [Actinophytocola sp.]
MSDFQVDLGALRNVQDELSTYRDQLRRHAHAAQELINSVPHSTAPKPDPVANQMRREYRSLAGSETGVRGLLEDYIDELDDMIDLLEDTRRAYSAGDLNAIEQLSKAYGEGH